MTDVADTAPVTTDTSTDTYTPVFKKDVKKKDADQEDAEFSKAKAYLSTKLGGNNASSVYDHLTTLVARILETKPANAYNNFEDLSAQVKRSKFSNQGPPALNLKAVPEPSGSLDLAQAQIAIFKHKKVDEDAGEIPDILDLANLWEWAGLSFGKDETFVLLASVKKLVDEKPIKSVRLWGKILGTQKNYIVVEAELKDGIADDEEEAANPKEEPKAEQPATEASDNANPELDEKDAPKPKSKPVPTLTSEQRSGANKYVYYVCNYAGGQWTRLPDVIPEKLQISRKIRKLFTGDLTKKIVSYPSFGYTEAQYLRCQIARIAAATVCSPAGYYIPDPEESEGDGNGASIIINTEFEGLPNDQLLSPANWVHHVPFILPQGRVIWESPSAKKATEDGEANEDENEEKGEEDENAAEPEPETGPSILSPLNADEDNGDSPSWVSRYCSTISPQKFSPVVLRSTRWPGASVVSYNDKFASVYIGYGLKDLGSPVPKFAPPALPPVQSEYAIPESSPEILVELLDPTIEAEAAYEAEQKAKEDAEKEGEEPEGEEAEEEE